MFDVFRVESWQNCRCGADVAQRQANHAVKSTQTNKSRLDQEAAFG